MKGNKLGTRQENYQYLIGEHSHQKFARLETVDNFFDKIIVGLLIEFRINLLINVQPMLI